MCFTMSGMGTRRCPLGGPRGGAIIKPNTGIAHSSTCVSLHASDESVSALLCYCMCTCYNVGSV